jgi:hypothetical protein
MRTCRRALLGHDHAGRRSTSGNVNRQFRLSAFCLSAFYLSDCRPIIATTPHGFHFHLNGNTRNRSPIGMSGRLFAELREALSDQLGP